MKPKETYSRWRIQEHDKEKYLRIFDGCNDGSDKKCEFIAKISAACWTLFKHSKQYSTWECIKSVLPQECWMFFFCHDLTIT